MTIVTVKANDGPRNAFIDKQSSLRYYRWGDRTVPSVTSIRNMAGQPHALVSWKISRIVQRACGRIVKDEQGRETGWEEGSLAELTEMLSREPRPRERVVEKNRIKEASAWLRSAFEEERDIASARGTAVHKAAEQGIAVLDIGDYTDPESGVTIPAEEIRPKYRQYLDWLQQSGIEVLLSERQIWNLTLGYAGSFDILGRFPNGEVWIVDIKTGKHTYSDHVLQQIAYLMGEFIGQDDVVDDDATALLHQVAGVAILHLADDGWTFIRPEVDSEAWAAFRGLLAFATWTRDHDGEAAFTVAKKSGAAS